MNEDNDDLTQEEREEIVETIEYEAMFYEVLSGTTSVEIIPIPDPDGEDLTDQDIKLLQIECKKEGLKLLYRISRENHAVIFDPESLLVGVVPENSSDGFAC